MQNKISYKEAQKIIREENLKLYNNIWHYSFNKEFIIEKEFFHLIKNGTSIVYTKALNEYSPAILFSKDGNLIYDINVKNILNGCYQKENQEYRKLFWFVRTNSFNEFLEKRANTSKYPRKSFPTSYTYSKVLKKSECYLKIVDFDYDLFELEFNKLKNESYNDAKVIYSSLDDILLKHNNSWLKLGLLLKNDQIKSINFFIDDGRSITAESTASERSKLGYGIIAFTELYKYCCNNNYHSFNGGVSGLYGTYKSKIFLESFEVSKVKENIYKKVSNKIKSIWS